MGTNVTMDDVQELQALKDEMEELLECASTLLGARSPNWIATVKMALSHDHQWIGGNYDVTFQDTIDAMKNEIQDEESSELEQLRQDLARTEHDKCVGCGAGWRRISYDHFAGCTTI